MFLKAPLAVLRITPGSGAELVTVAGGPSDQVLPSVIPHSGLPVAPGDAAPTRPPEPSEPWSKHAGAHGGPSRLLPGTTLVRAPGFPHPELQRAMVPI